MPPATVPSAEDFAALAAAVARCEAMLTHLIQPPPATGGGTTAPPPPPPPAPPAAPAITPPPSSANPGLLRVGADKPYKRIADAVAAVAWPNAVIEIDPGTYNESFVTPDNVPGLTLKAMGQGISAPTIMTGQGLGRFAYGKAGIVFRSNGQIVGPWLFTDYGDHNGNGADGEAAIRPDANCRSLFVTGVEILRCENGIFAAVPGLVLSLAKCTLHGNGITTDGRSHNLYVSQADRVTISGCYFEVCAYGHEVKSRAAALEIASTTIITGKNGRAIDACEGGDLKVTGGAITKPADALQGEIIGYALENQNQGIRDTLFDGVTINNQRSPGFIHSAGGTMTFRGCSFPGKTITKIHGETAQIVGF